ncbi:MAG: ATP-dependent DNA ligase [Desulfobacteraceae bacterium 4572_130]|nr:MAG: ATP-dependent DNA ligase [Desulfobacteraceae bacterium 4572_130]
MRYFNKVCFIILIICFSKGLGLAHFGMIIPNDNMVMQRDFKKININLSFSHPFEGQGMELVKPAEFFVVTNDKKKNLLGELNKTKIMDNKAWTLDFNIKKPGVYNFCMIPQPFWEPTEDCFIIHYTKTVVAAFGADNDWDKEIGLKTEIIPLAKPFGLYAGNLFQGMVKFDNKPVPYSKVEVEYYNKNSKVSAPCDYMITQTIKADKNGVFSYAVPASGWWGFAALNNSDKKMMHKGQEKDIELGAVLWVKFEKWHMDN